MEYFHELDDDSTSDPGNSTPSDPELQQAGKTMALAVDENHSKIEEMEVVLCPGAGTHAGDEFDIATARTPTAPEGEAGNVTSRKNAEERGAFDPWAVGGVVLSSLSASADALLTDGSKTVRAKALACSLCILTAHGGSIELACFDDGTSETGGAQCGLNALKTTLQAVRLLFKLRHQHSEPSDNAFKVTFNGCDRRKYAPVRVRGENLRMTRVGVGVR